MDSLEHILGHEFKNKSLLKQALTHPSIAQKSNYVKLPDYERLEFLGDTVLSLIVTEMLLDKFKNDDEGMLAKKRATLICGSTLSKVAINLQFDKYLIMSDGEEKSGGKTNPRILENAMEAVIGAMYLDSGLEVCKRFIVEHWQENVADASNAPVDPKAHLQEWAQQHAKPIPNYKITEREGPAHKPIFTIEVNVDGMPVFTAQGGSRKIAEKLAAQQLITYIEQNEHDHKI